MPTANLKAKLSIDGKKAQSQIKTLSGRVNKAFSKIKPLAGMLIGGAAGYAFVNATKKVMDFDMSLTRLAIQGHKTAAEQKKVREEIMGVSTATGMAKEEIVAAAKSIIDSTGDFEFMASQLENLASLSRTTGSDMGLLGRIAGSLKNQFNLSGDAAAEMMRVLVEQGELGSWTLEEMASTAPKVFAALQMAGVKTEKEIKDATAYMQVFRVGFATAEEAATAYKGTVARLAMEQSKFEAMGVKFDKDGKARSTAEVLVDILDKMNAADYEGPSLVKLFGTENIALVTAMQKTYEEAKEEGKDLTEVMTKYTDVTGDAGTQAKKLARVNKGAAGQVDKFKATIDDFVVSTLASDENMQAFGLTLEGLTTGIIETTKGIQWVAEQVAKAADKFGFIDKGDTAQANVNRSAVENKARSIVEQAKAAPIGAATPEQQQFLDWYEKKTYGDRLSHKSAKGKQRELQNSLKWADLEQVKKDYGMTLSRPGQQQDKSESVTAPPQEVRFADGEIDKLAKEVKDGVSKAKPVVEMPTPLNSAGGTTGAPAH